MRLYCLMKQNLYIGYLHFMYIQSEEFYDLKLRQPINSKKRTQTRMPKRSRNRLPLRQFSCCKHRWGERVPDENAQSKCRKCNKMREATPKGEEATTPYNAVCVTRRSVTSAGSRMSNQRASLFTGTSGRSLTQLRSIAAVDVMVKVTVLTLTEMVLLKLMCPTRQKGARDLLTVFCGSQTVQ